MKHLVQSCLSIIMRLNSFVICLIYFTLAFNLQVMAMTKEQIKNSGKLIKKSCLQKHDVTEQQLQMISRGEFTENKEVMCFISCIFSTSQWIKNNKINTDNMIRNVEMMFPEDMKKSALEVIQQCRGVPKKYKDICESAFWFTKCIHDADPPNFMFV